ncbi:hypothetical protein LCGC14_1891850 [marine sediment metagenome]|uniref:Uncharacterized protein n=1 Tax=marine sediment metagenome TaxID=412755 RepID=A0A0F9FZF7_9ZZZZ
MKLGEAITRLKHLDLHLERLASRLINDHKEGRPLTPILSEVESIANRARDIKASINWTRQQIAADGVPIGTYVVKREYLLKMADVLFEVSTPDIRAKVDELVQAANEVDVIIQTVNWSVDLQVPEITAPEEEIAPEEE